jgi:hypothetical protein
MAQVSAVESRDAENEHTFERAGDDHRATVGAAHERPVDAEHFARRALLRGRLRALLAGAHPQCHRHQRAARGEQVKNRAPLHVLGDQSAQAAAADLAQHQAIEKAADDELAPLIRHFVGDVGHRQGHRACHRRTAQEAHGGQ